MEGGKQKHKISGMVVNIHILPLTPCSKTDNEENRITVNEISLTHARNAYQ
jgi:hypothetical protein